MDLAQSIGSITIGMVLVVVAIVVYWRLHTQWGKSLMGIVLFFLGLGAFLAFVFPLFIQYGVFGGMKNNDAAWTNGWADYQATHPKGIVSAQQVQNFGAALSFKAPNGQTVASGQQAQVAQVQAQTGQTVAPQTQTVAQPTPYVPIYENQLNVGSLISWAREKFGCVDSEKKGLLECLPSDWLTDASQALVPTGATARVQCVENCSVFHTGGKANEFWLLTITAPGGYTPAVMRVNSFIAADSRSFKGSWDHPSTLVGTGPWETCTSCFTQVLTNPQPAVVPTPVAPASVQPSAPQAQQAVGPAEGTEVTIDRKAGCGYGGWKFSNGAWMAIPTTGGRLDYEHLTPEDKARGYCSTIPAHP